MLSLEKLVTIIIVSYKSKSKLISILKSIPKKIKVIIIENSYDYELKKLFEKKFKNTKIILKKNIGYGNAINFGSRYVKTKYFFALNPDVQIYKETIKNLIYQGMLLKNNLKSYGVCSKNLCVFKILVGCGTNRLSGPLNGPGLLKSPIGV